jgi:hypothetical protein
MSVKEIQLAVRRLPAGKRRRLTTWMVREFPALTVDDLIAKAERKVKAGSWSPTPPTRDNVPTGAMLEHAARTARRLGIAK